ncbi:hypothetical protein DM01DRAFT_1410244 [Hesseltinella vesiculosa]|uniref:Uncharacterized protein n=1 Tax=Hesseltinella vesiculosa TaxID=101127 RepID=A0A1X2G9C0_9FUNG|nr:hypothetical protein DM01DRAFT_1410244 [Hesseltinella vesiculosa]
MTSVQYNVPFTAIVERHSSSTFMAHLIQQACPPKLQPRSSSTRDRALLDTFDKVDAEAGCILIALANRDKRKDMNDLIPYSIRIKEDDRFIDPLEPPEPLSHSSSVSSSSSSSSSTTSHLREESVCTTSTSPASLNNDPASNHQLSIQNLLGHAKPSSVEVDRTTMTSKKPMTLTSAYQDPGKASWRPSRKPDPILLLAEAARAIHHDDQHRPNLKRKFREDESNDSDNRLNVPDYVPPTLQHNEKSKFSYQYHSMKQNPKIKRNAMHAYITYMIYTDLAANEKKRKPTFERPLLPSNNISAMPSPPSKRTKNQSAPWMYTAPSTNTLPAMPPSLPSIMSRPLTAFLRDDLYH